MNLYPIFVGLAAWGVGSAFALFVTWLVESEKKRRLARPPLLPLVNDESD